ncbi:MAG: SBBP repeat-containing protein [Acidobacteria bacterium]|nr:SBBP repeat-containing protein [Acidobacteriota bacterium]
MQTPSALATPFISSTRLRLLAIVPLLLAAAAFGMLLSPPAESARPSSSADGERRDAASRLTSRADAVAAYGKLPLLFEANAGQTDESVRYVARGVGYNLFLTKTEAVLALRERSPRAVEDKGQAAGGPEQKSPPASFRVLRMRLDGAADVSGVTGLDEQPSKYNYFLGADPARWRTNVPVYGKVRLAGVYKGIDLVYYGNQRQLEYDFNVAPGADPRAIRLRFEGAERAQVNGDGDLLLELAGGEVRMRRPFVYQTAEDGGRQEVEGRYVVRGRNAAAFEVGTYDRRRALVIDPVLSYSTYLGGSSNDIGNGIAVGSDGSAYVTGYTGSLNFPTKGRTFIPPDFSAAQVFVTRLNPAGSGLVYSTLVGGTSSDIGAAIAVDAAGSAYVTGATSSTDFPTVNALRGSGGAGVYRSTNGEAFVFKLGPAGDALAYSTYLGGSGIDDGEGIAVDAAGQAHVAGTTTSADFPLVNPRQATHGGGFEDAFAVKLDAAGGALLYSTYIGGSGADKGQGAALDPAGNFYVTGRTLSPDFPVTPGAFQTTIGNAITSGGYDDAFVTKLDATGSSYVYSTYLGGNHRDIGYAVAADPAGNAYVAGSTESSNFPLVNPAQSSYGGGSSLLGDAFVTKLNASGTALAYSTYLGGAGFDYARGIAAGADGSAVVVGATASYDFPVTADSLRLSGLIWRSTDGGAAWDNRSQGILGRLNQIVFDPQTPTRAYAVGERGIFRSTDEGQTWERWGTPPPNASLQRIAIDPQNPSVLYLTALDDAATGIYKSTDGGVSWVPAKGNMNFYSAEDVVVDPASPNNLYLISSQTIFKSANGGASWSAFNDAGLPQPVNVRSFTLDPTNTSNLYVTTRNSPSRLYKFTNGVSWSPADAALPPGTQPFGVRVVPSSPAAVFALTTSGVYKSVDGGTSWALSFDKSAFDLASAPGNVGTLYLAADEAKAGGAFVYKSTDGGATWRPTGGPPNLTLQLALNSAGTILGLGGNSGGGGLDAFVTKLDAAGSSFVYSTCFGGPGPTTGAAVDDTAYGVALDAAGAVYVTGSTRASDFPVTAGAFQVANRGGDDAFVAKLVASFSVGGTVTNGGAPQAGVRVTLTGDELRAATTGADGSYSFVNLRPGGNYTVSASKSGFTYAPPGQTFNNLSASQTVNFSGSAAAQFHIISGRVTEAGGAAVPGAAVSLSGSQTDFTVTGADGAYSFSVPAGGNYTVTASALGFSFTPPARSFNALGGDVTGDFTAARQDIVVTNTGDHGAGSLRQALLDAEAIPGADRIVFNIPGGGVKTITPLVALPEQNGPVVIDASTQPGYAGAPLVELDGANTVGANGLRLNGGASVVRGLSVFRFSFNLLLVGDGNVVEGCYLGLNAAGAAPASQPNATGVSVRGSNNRIGGTQPGEGNVISGNGWGVRLFSGQNVVQGNRIGTDAAGSAPVANTVAGVTSDGHDNQLGGDAPGAGNLVAFNQAGVLLQNPSAFNNDIRGNSIFSNAGLGIDLGTDLGATPDDPLDADSGPNLLQNFPVLAGVTSAGGTTHVEGTLNSTPGTQFRIDFYSNLACDAAGYGEGARPFGSMTLTTNSAGDAHISADLPSALAAGRVLTATATDPTGNTSEFSPCDPTSAQGAVAFAGRDYNVLEDVGQATIRVVRTGGSRGTLTVNYATGGGTATAGADYTPASGQLTFAEGETEKSFNIPVADDGVAEPEETLTLTLGGTAEVESLGSYPRATLHIFDSSTPLTLAPENPPAGGYSFTEGDGGRRNAVIPVRLSAAAGRTVTVDYATVAGTASANSDFVPVSGTLTFAPGTERKEVAVPIVGDTSDEFDESFDFTLSNPSAGVSVLLPEVFVNILDDDAPPALSVTDVAVREGGGAKAAFAVRLSQASGKDVAVTYSTADGTAAAGSDYTATNGSFTFAPGQSVKLVEVPILTDAAAEGDETFFLNVNSTSQARATVADGQGQATIQDAASSSSLVQFGAPAFGVGEGEGQALIVVTRTGDTSQPASVDYRTAGQTASERSDFTAAAGTLRFAAGEAQKTFAVLVTDDRFKEPSESLDLLLSNPSGAALGGPSVVPLTITSDDSADRPSPVRESSFDTQFFVRQHYHDFLNREPDPDGLQFWTGEIDNCTDAPCREVKRINVSAAFFLSIEFQETGYLAYRTYKAAYGDATSPNVAGTVPVIRLQEFLPDSQRIGQGVRVGIGNWEQQLEANKQAYMLEFVRRQRFADAFPASLTAAQFVERLNQNAGGVLSQGERDQLVAELAAAPDQTQGRAAALRRVADDADMREGEKKRAFVLMQFYGYLRRDPDAAPDADFRGWKFWLDKLNQFNGNYVNAEMVKAFLSSDEYRQRFGQ